MSGEGAAGEGSTVVADDLRLGSGIGLGGFAGARLTFSLLPLMAKGHNVSV